MSLSVLIAVTHLLGAGHLTRAATLARAFAAAGHRTTLVTGGMPAALRDLNGISLVQLPPVRTIGTSFTTLLTATGEPADAAYLERRREQLLQALGDARPDIVITELFPFGRRALSREFEALLAEARTRGPRPLILCSIRDILVASSKPGRIAETHERLHRFYDAVLVHGDPALIPLDASWPVDERIRPLIHYTGYVDEDLEPVAEAPRNGIIVSGGSSAAGLPLYRAALAAAETLPDMSWRLLVGRGVAEDGFRDLAALAPAHVAVERARPDFRVLLGQAEVSVSQAGYNTVVDLLRSGVKPVLVPFEAGHETEQRLRAERLKELGRAAIVPETALSGPSLAETIRRTLASPSAPSLELALNGAGTSVAIAEKLFQASPALHRPIDWSPLDQALQHAKDQGCPVGFWWRDDDAVADTPRLDRLLRLADRSAAEVGLAVIPDAMEISLADRLTDGKAAYALVHGASHANHAPPGEKKAEFGAHRPLETLRAEAEQSLLHLKDRLGDKLLPVFVPPWNRIAPALVPLLAGSGYVGLSTFRDRTMACPAPGLVQINTHLDPIDWHGTRSLVDPQALVLGLAHAVERRVAGDADSREPVGFLTHHLVHDEAVWRFCEALADHLAGRGLLFLSIQRLLCHKSRITVEL